jgi:glycosyltransferase involved in cell wall biosynthesis
MPTPEHLRTVPNGVELEMFSGVRRRTVDDSGNLVRKQTVVYTGTLAPYQGIEAMLEIFSRVATENSSVVFKIVSESSFKPYERLARELRIRKKIELVGAKLTELSGLLEDADVAVNPRTNCPGLPQKNLNYMAAALPIVCFSSSSKELVANETALVVDDGDVSGFSKAICHLLDNPEPAAALGARGRRYVKEHRSWEASARLAEQFFGHLIETSQRDS